MHTYRLLIPPEVHFVGSGSLPRKSQACVLPSAVIESLMRKVGIVCPLRHIAGILVSPQRHILAITLITSSPVKPEPVFFNRTSNRAIDVPDRPQLVGSAQTSSLQGPREIASLQSRRRAVR